MMLRANLFRRLDRHSLFFSLFLLVMVRGELAAQESSPPAAENASATAAPAPATGPARQAYEEVFTKWKGLLKQLRDEKAHFTVGEERDLPAIRERYFKLLAEGEALIPVLREKAVDAYREAPEADRELVRLLVKLVEDDVQHDRYEPALQVAKALLDAGAPDKALYDFAAIAAFSLEEFDLAKTYAQAAHDAGVIDKSRAIYSQIDGVQAGWKHEQELRAAEANANLPRVKLVTSKGEIVLELFENEAPDTVGNFVSLVEKGFYNGLTFHRVIAGFMAQGGCPRGDGQGGPGYKIYCESYRDDHRNHFRGSLSMAKETARNTGGSQFFITFRPTPDLDGIHTVFGRVVEGIEVLEKLTRRDPGEQGKADATPDTIIKAEVLRKRDHEYRPNKVTNEKS